MNPKLPTPFTFLFILLLATLTNCSSSAYDKEMPNDFSFKVIGELDRYDSASGIYKRSYTSGDSTVEVHLSEAEMQRIYAAFVKIDFLRFPNEFECQKYGDFTFPSFSTTIIVTYKGKRKEATNTTFCDRKIQQTNAENFDKFSSLIFRLLHRKPPVQELKNSDFIFM